MAILNEWAIMGPNYFMLVIGIIGVICGFVLVYVASEMVSTNCVFTRALSFALALILIGLCIPCMFIYDDEEFQIKTDKSYIEATFANGEIPAVYLKKYNVIDVNDNVYLLEKKDGVKDDNRPRVRIGEK